MALYHFHRVLIGAAILFDFLFTFYAIRQFNLTGDSMQLWMGIISSIITIGLVAYLVYFNRKLALLNHMVSHRND